MDWIQVIFGVIGGLALFLYGIHILSEGLQKAASGKLKTILEKLTSNRLKGVGVGALTTAIIQSSSITTVTLIGLINAGLLSLEHSIPIIMGSNIGTTVTAQLVAFKIGSFALPIIAVGFALYFLSRKKEYAYIGQTILGFGLLFLGMYFMTQGVSPLKESAYFINLLSTFGQIPILGILAGAIFTAIIQSSSATSGLVIALGMEGLIDLNSAIPLILGANIGTCATVLLASIGASLSSKRAALSHILFNIIGVVIFFPFIYHFAQLIALTSMDLARQIANAHVIFNVAATMIILPFVGVFIQVVKKLIPGEEITIKRAKHLDDRILNTPSIALSQVSREVNRMGKMSSNMLEKSISSFLVKDAKTGKQQTEAVLKQEEVVDEIYGNTGHYSTKLSARGITPSQSKRLACLLHASSDIERVADHANSVAGLARHKIRNNLTFSDQALKDLQRMLKKVKYAYDNAIKSLRDDDKVLAERVSSCEEEINQLEKEFIANHVKRLKKGICDPASGIVFVDVLRNLRRVGNHACNIAHAVLLGF